MNAHDWPVLEGIGDALAFFVIFDRPLDFPQHFVVRRQFATRGCVVNDVVPRLAASLEEARQLVPPGLYRQPRQDGDDAFIVETWF